MKHVMLDIETLDTKPSAIVLSYAFVPFTIDGPDPSWYGANLATKEQYAAGRTMSLDTIEWWMDFGSTYPKKNRQAPWVALNNTAQCLKGLGEFTIWAKPPSFDLVIMENLFGLYDIEIPWNYRMVRDVRTMADFLTPEERVIVNAVKHDAYADCVEQIELVTRVWRKHDSRQS